MSDALTILLVDDDRADRLAIRDCLRRSRLEFNLIEADDVAGGLQAAGQRPDCALLDIRLSGESGLALLRMLRQADEANLEFDRLPVIVLTGRGDERTAVEAMKAGATDYVPKTELTPDRIGSCIRNAIEVEQRRGDARRSALELQRAHAELERRVCERTADLQRAVEELRQRNAELDEFTYVASHDLQEPLRKLVAFSDLLPRDLGRIELNETAQADLGFIVEAARRMQTLVQDLLALSRAGKAAVRRERCALDDCVERALESLETRVSETQAQIDRDSLPEVIGDPTLLTQLYQNLIGNALKFRIHDRKPVIQVTAERGPRGWEFGVRDNGIGLKPEYAEQIFAPFKRLHGREEYEGTGIGLAICRKIVGRHAGRIWVESAPGAGAHFRFTLGFIEENAECQPASESSPSCSWPKTTPESRSLPAAPCMTT